MATTDSGIETLFSDESPPPLPPDCHLGSVAAAKPPNIQPFSGVLEQGKCVIRPIAFKASLSATARFGRAGERYGSTPILTRSGSRLALHGSESLNASHSVSASPSPTMVLELTPSPSDSGVSELEAALRDRDSELAYLRQTMEHNEQAIVRVYQEKERCWARDLRRLRNLHEQSVRASSQKASRMEQMVTLRDCQRQQERERLAGDAQRAVAHSERLAHQVRVLRERLEATEWSLCEKTGEVSLLKRQLKEVQLEQMTRGQELVQARSECKHMTATLTKRERNVGELQSALAMQVFEVEALRAQQRTEIEELRQQLADAATSGCDGRKDAFEQERAIWAQEKAKVLRYQRQLQMNYVQMYRRTRALETQVDSLSRELQVAAPPSAVDL